MLIFSSFLSGCGFGGENAERALLMASVVSPTPYPQKKSIYLLELEEQPLRRPQSPPAPNISHAGMTYPVGFLGHFSRPLPQLQELTHSLNQEKGRIGLSGGS